ncbi:MAG: hypothetical protein QOG31_419 [Thermoplasmata archaeon]|jgi:predicted RNA binding protein YcfA (HicA-like mRNA interferase family)|nr:hypothetical protein [Thermoplasmata archaeon]
MVPKVPPMSYREVHRFLQEQGFHPKRQIGSHIFYAHPDGRSTVVPRHGKDLKPRLVAKLLKEAGIDPDTVRR